MICTPGDPAGIGHTCKTNVKANGVYWFSIRIEKHFHGVSGCKIKIPANRTGYLKYYAFDDRTKSKRRMYKATKVKLHFLKRLKNTWMKKRNYVYRLGKCELYKNANSCQIDLWSVDL